MAAKEAEDKLQRITKLLEKGGTMLAQHHECGAPMFRFQGKVMCPVCDFPERPEIKVEQKPDNDHEAPLPRKVFQPLPGRKGINEIITKKVDDIVLSLEGETDLARVKDKMDCIEQGIRIMKLLKRDEL